MITMRDGIRLFTVVFTPKKQTEPLPFLLLRTPYGVSDQSSPEKTSYVKDMAEEGYIFVYQDIRGRYNSEGTFEMQRFSRDKTDKSRNTASKSRNVLCSQMAFAVDPDRHISITCFVIGGLQLQDR